jgi:hypothetical protein
MTPTRRHALSAAALLLAIAAPHAAAQAPAQNVPDLTGVYLVRDFRGNLADMSPEFRGKGYPMHAEELKRLKAFQTMRDKLPPEQDPSPSARCLPPGLTFIMTAPYPFEIVQTPTKVLTYHDFGNFVRQIRLTTRDHGDPTPSWLGHSVGWFEGDTLVVDTVGFNGKAWLDASGLRSSDKLHTVERFRKVKGEIEYSVRIEDPDVFTQPWTAMAHFAPQPGFEIEEFVCLDNNKILESPGQHTPVAR